jgi:hypothetical protein
LRQQYTRRCASEFDRANLMMDAIAAFGKAEQVLDANTDVFPPNMLDTADQD